MSESTVYEIKFHQYNGNESQLDFFSNHYRDLKDYYLNEGLKGSVNSKVISYFFDGMIMLTYADKAFWSTDYFEAEENYRNAIRFFKRFQNSRGIEVRLDKLAKRIIFRCEGLEALAQSLALENPKMRIEQLGTAVEKFNTESSLAAEMNDDISALIAYSRALLADAYIWEAQSTIDRDTDTYKAKVDLMNSRMSLKQSTYMDQRLLSTLMKIENKLDDLTKERILVHAEVLGNTATDLSENGKFLDAKAYFQKATLFYNRASSLVADSATRRFLLSMQTVLEASVLECDGNYYYRQENDMHNAQKHFLDAARLVEKAIALMGSFGSDELRLTFESQLWHYRAMAKFTEGIEQFDLENYNEATDAYNEAENVFKDALDKAEKSNNEPLIELINQALADLEGYRKLVDTFM